MFKSLKNDKNYLYLFLAFILLTLSYLITEYVMTGHRLGVPLDDTWIHFRFAENFAQGHFFEYNIGHPTPGTTSPLWVIILSIPFIFSDKLILAYSLILGTVFFFLTTIEIYRLSIKLGFDRNYSLLISILTLLAGRIMWSSLSGMEITLFCYLTVLIISNHLIEIETNRIIVFTGLLLGISINVRPEAYLLAGMYYIVTLVLMRKSLKANMLKLAISLLLFVVTVLPYQVFCYVHTGSFLPNTFEGQNAGLRFIPDMGYVSQTARYFIKDNVIVFLLLITASVYFIHSLIVKRPEKKYLLMNLWIFLLPLISAFIAPNWRHHGRYLIPLIPFINIIAIYILLEIIAFFKERNLPKIEFYRKAVISLLVLFTLVSTFIFANALGWNVDNINEQQVKIAEWLNKNLPDEKIFGMNDIGAITYITNKKIVDMEGLVTPEIFQIRKLNMLDQNRRLMELLKKKGVNYIIIYPSWYVSLMGQYGNIMEKVYSARLVKNTICGDIELFVFKIHWEEYNTPDDTEPD
jgi:hypothetical protein